MVQQNETRDLAFVLSEEPFDRIGANGQLFKQTVSQSLEVFRFEVLGATIRSVGTGDVDSPEVVVLDGEFGKDRIDGVFDELHNSAWVLIIDLFALGFGNPQEAQRGVSVHGKLQRLGPDLIFKVRVEIALGLEVWGIEQLVDVAAASGDFIDVIADHVRKGAGGASEVETLFGMVEELDPAVPVFSSGVGKAIAKFGGIERLRHRQMPFAKHVEELLVFEVSNRGGFQLQQGVLPGVHVHGVDVSGACQQIVQRIATGGTDHQQSVFGAKIQRLAIEPGIFPAGVVDEVVSVDELKYTAGDPFTDWHRLKKSKLLTV